MARNSVGVSFSSPPNNESSEIKDSIFIKKKLLVDNTENIDKEFLYLNSNRSVFNIIKEEYIIDEEIFTAESNFTCKRNKLYINDEFDGNVINNSENTIQTGTNQDHEQRSESGNTLRIPVTPLTEKRYTCIYCKKTYKHKCHANRHMIHECPVIRSENREKTKFYCEVCDRYFVSKFSLNRHTFFLHSERCMKISCGICRQQFRYKHELENHLLSKCEGAQTLINKIKNASDFTCQICSRRYRDNASLHRHTNYECGKKPRFSCAHCDYRSLQKANLVRHLARLHSKHDMKIKVPCPNCPKAYKNQCTLKRHLQFECGKEPSFACERCNYKTKRKSCLTSHVMNKHP